MTVETTAIDGLLRIAPKSISDERGTVREYFRVSSYVDAAHTPASWSQVNLTWTKQGAVRGLHGESMTKLVGLAGGEAFGAYLDARPTSPTFGRVVTATLALGVQLLVPPGVCNGFQAISNEGCQYLYCFDREWVPDMPGVAVNPLDPDLAIRWPITPTLSAKDANAPYFSELAQT